MRVQYKSTCRFVKYVSSKLEGFIVRVMQTFLALYPHRGMVEEEECKRSHIIAWANENEHYSTLLRARSEKTTLLAWLDLPLVLPQTLSCQSHSTNEYRTQVLLLISYYE